MDKPIHNRDGGELDELREMVRGLQETVSQLRDKVDRLEGGDDHEDDQNGFPGWNGYHRSAEVEEAIGLETYARFWPETFMGEIASNEELHLATIVEMTALAGEHAAGEDMAAFARDWTTSLRMIRAGAMRRGVVRLDIAFGGAGAAIFATLEADQIITTMLCTCTDRCGAPLGDPLVYWRSDNGGMSNAIVDEYEEELVDLQVLAEGVRLTGIHLEAQRVQDLRPEGVVDLGAARMRRTARGM